MDLLYAKYASPFDYLQALMDTHNLTNGICYIINNENERKLWELYLHSFPSESFDSWKNKLKDNTAVKELNEREVINQVNKSNDILKNFQIN